MQDDPIVAARFGLIPGVDDMSRLPALVAAYQAYSAHENQQYNEMLRKGLRPEGTTASLKTEAEFARLPAQEMERLIDSIPRDLLEKTRFGVDVPQGYVLQHGAERAFNAEAFTASYLEAGPAGLTTTFKLGESPSRGSKWEKSVLQRTGVHEQVFHADRPIYTDTLLAGPGSRVPGQYQEFTGAYLLGGPGQPSPDPFHGMGLLTETAGEAIRRHYYEVRGTGLEFAELGTTFKPGENIVLAKGLTGYENRLWNQRVVGRVALPGDPEARLEPGYGFIVEQRSNEANIKWPSYSSKSMMLPGQWNITTATGQPLEFMASLKDALGPVYEHFRARQRYGNLTQELGLETLPRSYAELAPVARQKFMSYLERMVQPVRAQIPIHEANLERFGPAVVATQDIEGMPHHKLATLEYMGLVGTYAKEATLEYDPRRQFLSGQEWDAFRKERPEAALHAAQFGWRRRQAYRDIIRAGATSAGLADMPSSVVSIESMEPQLRNVMMRAEALAKEATGSEEPPLRAIMDKFYNLVTERREDVNSPWREAPFIDWGGGLVTPSFSRVGRMGAPGEYVDEMVGKYVTAVFNMARAQTGWEPTGQERTKMFDAQAELAASSDVWKEAQGMHLPDWMVDYRAIWTHPAVPPNAAVVPLLPEGGIVQGVRQPSEGRKSYDPDMGVEAMPHAQAEQLGISTDRLTFAEDVTQLMKGDDDGDKAMAIASVRGDLRAMSIAKAQQLAELAVQRGSSPLSAEHPQSIPSREEAIAGLRQSLENPTTVPWDQITGRMEGWRNLKELVGPAYNIFRRMTAFGMSDAQEEAWQELFSTSYSFTQRPALPPDVVQAFHDLGRYKLDTGWAFSTVKNLEKDKLGVGEIPAQRESIIKGFYGLQAALGTAAYNLVKAGSPLYSAEHAALMIAPEAKAAEVAQMFEAKSAADFVGQYVNAVPLKEMLTQTPAGAGYGARAVARYAADNPNTDLRMALQKGKIDPETIDYLVSQAQRQEDIVATTSSGDIDFATRVEAAQRQGFGWMGKPGGSPATNLGASKEMPPAQEAVEVAKRQGFDRRKEALDSGIKIMRRKAAGWISPSGMGAESDYQVLRELVDYSLSKAGEQERKLYEAAGEEPPTSHLGTLVPGHERMETGEKIHKAVQAALGRDSAIISEQWFPQDTQLGGVPIKGRIDIENFAPGGIGEIKSVRGLEPFLNAETVTPELREQYANKVRSSVLNWNAEQVGAYGAVTGKDVYAIPYLTEDIDRVINGEITSQEAGERSRQLMEKFGPVLMPQARSQEQLEERAQFIFGEQAKQADQAAEIAQRVGSGEIEYPTDFQAMYAAGPGRRRVRKVKRADAGGTGEEPPVRGVALGGGEGSGGSQRIVYPPRRGGSWDLAALGRYMQEYETLYEPSREAIMGGEGALTSAQAGGYQQLSTLSNKMGALLKLDYRASDLEGEVPGMGMTGGALLARADVTMMMGIEPDLAQLHPRAKQAKYEKAGESGAMLEQAPAIKAEAEKLLSGMKWNNEHLEKAKGMFQLMGSPELKKDFEDLHGRMKDAIKSFENAQEWAERALQSPAGQAVRQEALEIAQGQREMTPGFERRWQTHQRLNAMTVQPGQEGGLMPFEGVADIIAQKQAEADLAKEGKGTASSRFKSFLDEFSIGGAAIRMAVIGRYTTGQVSQWREEALPMQMARMQTAMSYGVPYEEALQMPAGQYIQYQTAMAQMRESRGQAALAGPMGLWQMMGQPDMTGYGSTVGTIGAPLLSGVGAGLMTGVGMYAAGTTLGIGALTAAAAPVALGVGSVVAGGLALGSIYQAGSDQALTREYAEIAQGMRTDLSTQAKFGADMRTGKLGTLLSQGFAAHFSGGSVDPEAVLSAERSARTQLDDRRARIEGTAAFRVERAIVNIEQVTGGALTQEQAANITGLLQLGGYRPEDIYGHGADTLAKRLTPMGLTGEAGQYIGAVEQFGRYLGITPGQGLQPFLGQLPTIMESAAQQQWMTSAQILGGVAQRTGAAPTLQNVERFAGYLGAGMPTYQAEILAAEQAGIGGIGMTLGALPGFSPDLFSRYLTPSVASPGRAARPGDPGMMTPGSMVGRQYAMPQMLAEEYNQLNQVLGLGMSQAGYNLMAQGRMPALSAMMNWAESQGVGPGAPTGEPLIGPDGVAPWYPQQRFLQEAQMRASQAYQRQGWNLSQQQLDASYANMIAGQQYQMGTGAWGGTSQGMRFGLWGAVDQAQAAIDYTQQLRPVTHAITDLQRAQSLRGWEYAGRGLEMGLEQSLENWGMSRRMWQEGVQYNRVMAGVQFGQMQTQQGWRQEDFAYGRQMAGFEYEFSMDELNRSISFASGREKEGLLRRREHMEEQYAMQEGRRGVEEDRAKTQMEWENQRFHLQQEHFERTTQLENERFEMQLEHILERYDLEKEKHEQQKKDMQDLWNLQDQARDIQEKYEDKREQYQLEEAKRQQRYYEEVVFPYQKQQHAFQQQSLDNQRNYYENFVFRFQEKELELQDRITKAQAAYQEYQLNSITALGQAYETMINKILGMVGQPVQPAAGGGGGGSVDFASTNSLKLVVDGTEFRAYVEDAGNRASSRRAQAGSWGNPYQ